jgi:hypothetical protein
MLEGLNDVEWDKLEHAYGSASDVPDFIRSLLSDDPDVRGQALWSLYGNIFHQGTRYEATPYAIPFIFELIKSPNTPEKVDLVKFTVDLALGYPEAYLPKGPNVDDWIQDAAELKDHPEYIEDDWMRHIDTFINCYKTVLKNISTYYDCMRDSEEDLRLMAIFAVAWFRESSKESAVVIRELLEKESNDNVIASALLSLSMLDAYSEDTSDLPRFKEYFSGEYDILIKISAAISLINVLQHDVDEEAIEFLIEKLPLMVQMEISPYDFPWNDGEIIGYVSEVLKFYGLESPEKIIPPMCKILKDLSGFQSFEITYSLLWMTFHDPSEERDWLLNKLNKYQKMVLRVLANNQNIWQLDGEEFSNFTMLMDDYNLPRSMTELRKFLNLK